MRLKKLAVFFMIGVLVVGCLSGCKDKDENANKESKKNNVSSSSIVFKVGKEKCSVSEAKVLLLNYQNQYRDVYGVDLWAATGEDNTELVTYIKDLTVSQLAEIYLMSHIGTDQDMELTEEEMAHVEAAAAAYYSSLNQEEKDYTGATEKDIKSLYEHYAMAQKVYATLTQGVSQEVSDDDARVMSVMQIYNEDEAKVRNAYNQLKKGNDFAKTAKTYGSLTSINSTINRADTPDDIEETVFGLSNKEYTEVLPLGEGYVIYYCVNNLEEELTLENKDVVLKQRMEDAVNKTYSTYAASTDSKLYTDKWSKVSMEPNEAMVTISFFDVFEEHCGEDY